MQTINNEDLARIVGGGDATVQPLTMPPGWSPQPPGIPGWVFSVADYLKYLGVVLAE